MQVSVIEEDENDVTKPIASPVKTSYSASATLTLAMKRLSTILTEGGMRGTANANKKNKKQASREHWFREVTINVHLLSGENAEFVCKLHMSVNELRTKVAEHFRKVAYRLELNDENGKKLEDGKNLLQSIGVIKDVIDLEGVYSDRLTVC